jgi:hypothetical protein
VRRVCRLPGEDRADFARKVARLREHFERFNVDTAYLCQWIMGLRKQYGDGDNNPASFGTLGDFILEPSLEGASADEKTRDRWRLHVFDDVAGYRRVSTLDDRPIPASLRAAMGQAAAALPGQAEKNDNVVRLFARLRTLEPQHRLVLLKSAAEWIVARYLRGVENWRRGHKAWSDEKADWEKARPQLTTVIREKYTTVYKQLKDPKRDDQPGLRKKNPRICPYERLKQNIDNCCYAGRTGHDPLCWKYHEFVKAQKVKDPTFNDKRFFEDAQKFAKYCAKNGVHNPSNVFLSPQAANALFADAPQQARTDHLNRFKRNWAAYLQAVNVTASTAVEKGCLPHCAKLGEKFEKSACTWNPHTKYCLEYKRALTNPDNGLDDADLALEPVYREWRRDFLAGPRKPEFRYPCARDLPMPKVFGDSFFEVDFDRSVLRLRLDDMKQGEWIEFGFIHWPRDYSPSREQIKSMVTSIHINFVSPSRVRAGFRFDVEHKQSRFAVSQDELDDLRSKTFPRRAHDQQFIDAARKRLLETFEGDPAKDLRILSIDMGMSGAHAALYLGTRHLHDVAIPIHKFDKLYTDVPVVFAHKKDNEGNVTPDARGLRKEHVGLHLKCIADGASKIAMTRQRDTENPAQAPLDSDFRGLKRHIRWMIRDWARLNAKQIIGIAEEHRCDVIVFESLRGGGSPDYHKIGDDAERQKAERVIYAYGQVRRKVTEKAVERGMRTVTAPYHKSSQVCHACGTLQENHGLWEKNKRQKKFACEQCKRVTDSDANAARVLTRVFLGEINLPDPRSEQRGPKVLTTPSRPR